MTTQGLPLRRVRPQAGRAGEFSSADFGLDALLAAKGGHRVSVCIPARNEASSLAQVVAPIHDELVQAGLVDELVVLDHDSSDDTARVAVEAGAAVVSVNDVVSDLGPALGKGDVLWRSLAVSTGDIVVWLDADLTSFHTGYVLGLVGPLLLNDDVVLVRAMDERSLQGVPGEGGRVTELVARPVIHSLFPHLSHVRQPLGGEYAIRRSVAEAVPFEVDYGVEIGLLIDVAAGWGTDGIAQVDVGTRSHRNRELRALREMSRQVLRSALSRTALGSSLQVIHPPRPPMHTVLLGGHRDQAAV